MSNDIRTFDMERSAELDVFEFMDAVGQETPVSPAIPDLDVRHLRLALIEEEYGELIHAMVTGNLVEIADACADLVVAVLGGLGDASVGVQNQCVGAGQKPTHGAKHAVPHGRVLADLA